MVVIRLSRGGSKKRPFYHVVVAHKQKARDKQFIERLGFYNPLASGKAAKLSFSVEKAQEWIAKGAQASDRVKKLIQMQISATESTAVAA